MLDHADEPERVIPIRRRVRVGASDALLLIWLRTWLALVVAVLAFCGILAWFVFYAAELERRGTGPSGRTFTDLVFPIHAFLVLVWLAGVQLAWVAALEMFAATSAPAMRPRAAAFVSSALAALRRRG